MSLHDEVARGLEALNAQPELQSIDFLEHKARFLAYLELLKRWNKTYNLTAIRDDRGKVVRHLLDSLVIAPFVKPEDFSGEGSGAGLPGSPLAICHPGRQAGLSESNGKNTRYLTKVKLEVGLDEVGQG